MRGIGCPTLFRTPSAFSFVVRKEGYARAQTPEFAAQPMKVDPPRELAPIRLEPAVSLSGMVVNPESHPAAGVWVSPLATFALRGAFTRMDAAGKFTIHNLPKGRITVSFHYGGLSARGRYLADGLAGEIKVRPPDPGPTEADRPPDPQPPVSTAPARRRP